MGRLKELWTKQQEEAVAAADIRHENFATQLSAQIVDTVRITLRAEVTKLALDAYDRVATISSVGPDFGYFSMQHTYQKIAELGYQEAILDVLAILEVKCRIDS